MQTPETNKDPNAIELVEATNLQVGQTYFFPEGGHEYSYAKNAPTVDNHFDDSQKFESKQGDTFRIINEIKYTYDKNLLEIEHTNPLDNSAPQRMWVEDQTIASHGLAVDKRKGDNTPISPSRKTQLTDSLSDTDLRIDDTTKGTRLLTLRAVKQGPSAEEWKTVAASAEEEEIQQFRNTLIAARTSDDKLRDIASTADNPDMAEAARRILATRARAEEMDHDDA